MKSEVNAVYHSLKQFMADEIRGRGPDQGHVQYLLP